MDNKRFRILSILVVASLLLGLYFIRPYFTVVILSAIVAFLTFPIYKWYRKKIHNESLSLWLTFVTALIIVIIPVGVVVFITIEQAITLINNITAGSIDFGSVSAELNRLSSRFPSLHIPIIDPQQITDWLKNNVGTIGKSAIGIMFGVAGGFASYITKAVIFVYIYLSLLKHHDKIISYLQKLDPLGNSTTDLYLKKMGAMTSAMVKGQFVIALAQGLIDASLLTIVGFKYFVFWFVFITFLSIIPLGGGIIVMPIGVIMILTGNVWQGVLLIVGHLVIVTNIDNVLRPRFVPKAASLDSALTMLGVFAGLAMFGFLGIIIGPVIMVLIATTVQVYFQALNKKRGDTATTNNQIS